MSEERVVYFMMTDERKEHWARVSMEIIDVLKREFRDPIEAHSMVQFLSESLQQTYDIKETFSTNERMQ